MSKEIFQESQEEKQEWIDTTISNKFPVGSTVSIIDSDIEQYIGRLGKVVGYDIGIIGDYPLIRVELDNGWVDGFYDNEITRK